MMAVARERRRMVLRTSTWESLSEATRAAGIMSEALFRVSVQVNLANSK